MKGKEIIFDRRKYSSLGLTEVENIRMRLEKAKELGYKKALLPVETVKSIQAVIAFASIIDKNWILYSVEDKGTMFQKDKYTLLTFLWTDKEQDKLIPIDMFESPHMNSKTYIENGLGF